MKGDRMVSREIRVQVVEGHATVYMHPSALQLRGRKLCELAALLERCVSVEFVVSESLGGVH